MKSKRRRSRQLTCRCDAYSFPHRLTGGCCNALAWVYSYRVNDGGECRYCNSKHDMDISCDVADGRERLKYCPGYRSDLRSQMGMQHPKQPEYSECFAD